MASTNVGVGIVDAAAMPKPDHDAQGGVSMMQSPLGSAFGSAVQSPGASGATTPWVYQQGFGQQYASQPTAVNMETFMSKLVEELNQWKHQVEEKEAKQAGSQ